ncbi:MAG: C1 family peptidase [Anaeromyxobacteraceae bacterium]
MARKPRRLPLERRILNVFPSRGTEGDWGIDVAVASGAIRKVARLPREVDLREAWWGVGDQGATGACVGWAATDGVLRYHLVKARRLRKDQRLSPRFTWMASKETDGNTQRPETFIEKAGTSLKAALDVGRRYGSVLDSLLPFDVDHLMFTGDVDHFYAAASQRKVAGYYNLGRSLRAWRTWLASHGPVVGAIGVDDSWHRAGRSKGRLDRFRPSSIEGGHAVCVVGYRADGRFIVRNSWGRGWGDGGFAYATDAWVRAAFLAESYGITV